MGNVFTGVCHSVHRVVEGPSRMHLPCCRMDATPSGCTPLDTHPGYTPPSWMNPHPAATWMHPLDAPTPLQQQKTDGQQAPVRILMECILLVFVTDPKKNITKNLSKDCKVYVFLPDGQRVV